MDETFYNYYSIIIILFTQEPVLLGHTKRRALRRNDNCEDLYCGDLAASYFFSAAKVN